MEVTKEFPLNLGAGEASQEFFLHFNALLTDHQRSAQGTIRFQADGDAESITSGKYVIAGTERDVHFRILTSSEGEVKTVEGAGHSSNFEKPWEFDRHCIEFLARLGLYTGPEIGT